MKYFSVCTQAGCDKLTIAPKLLDELASSSVQVTPKLTLQSAQEAQIDKVCIAMYH